MTNPERLKLVKHYYKQNVPVSEIARIIRKDAEDRKLKKIPQLSTCRKLAYWYITKYELTRPKIKTL